MTDPRSTISDEDLCAVLDGTAPPSVLDRLARDPAARARRDELASVSARLAEPVTPLPAAVVEDLLARALATGPAYEPGVPQQPDQPPQPPGQGGPGGPADAGGQVLALPPRPSRSLPPTWLVAAVVTLLVAIGLGLVWSGRSADDEDRASILERNSQDEGAAPGAGDQQEDTDGAETSDTALPGEVGDHSAADPQGEGPARPSSTDAIGPAIYLGSFADGDELRESLAEAFPDEPADDADAEIEAPRDVSVDRCAEQMQVQFSVDDPVARQGYAEVDGEQVLVYEFEGVALEEGDDPTQLVTAVEPIACDPLFTFRR